jgi:hypothetical protein
MRGLVVHCGSCRSGTSETLLGCNLDCAGMQSRQVKI